MREESWECASKEKARGILSLSVGNRATDGRTVACISFREIKYKLTLDPTVMRTWKKYIGPNKPII